MSTAGMLTASIAAVAAIVTAQAQTFDLHIDITGGAGAALSWPSQGTGMSYTVQCRTNLVTGRWAPVEPWENWPIESLTVTDATTSASCYYRAHAARRGQVASIAFRSYHSASEIYWILFYAGIDLGITPIYGADVYEVSYVTLSRMLAPTNATGLLVLPRNPPRPADLLSYQHATMIDRMDAPSSDSSTEWIAGAALASVGYAVALPDYLGLGPASDGLHPYVHRRSEATAAVDMLRAARNAVAAGKAVTLSDRLFLTGYSQGGHSTLALQKELELKHAGEFRITASAPMAGPYDMSGTMADLMLTRRAYSAPEYVPYVLFAYNSVYAFFDDPLEVFVEPYATTLPPLYDGDHGWSSIVPAMPPSGEATDMLQPAFMSAVTNDADHPLAVALRDNDLHGWAPVSPTRLYHCAADDVVPFANAQVTYDSFVALGVDTNRVQLIDPFPAGTHETCAEPATREVIAWFETLR